MIYDGSSIGGTLLDGMANKRVLVVDDDPGQARLIAVLLQHEFDVEVETAYSCEEARERFAADAYDLVTLDYQLPDGDGLVLLEEFRGRAGSPPVVIITGHGDEQTAISAFKAGAFGYVVKDRRMSTMIVEEARSAMARAALLEAEAALAESRTRYQEIFETSKLGIMTFDERGRMEAINPACMEILGIADAADTRDISLFLPGYLSDEDRRRVQGGESVALTLEFDYDRVSTEGFYSPNRAGTAWLEGTITPLMRDGSGRPRGYLAQIADVTDRELKSIAIEAQRDLAVSAASAGSLEEALHLVLSAVLRASGFDGGGIYVLDEGEGGLRLAVHEGLSEAFVEEVDYYPPEQARVRMVLERQPSFLSYTGRPGSDPACREGLKSVVVVPLVFRDTVIGCLNVASRKLEVIDNPTREIILSLAGQAAQAIQREMLAEARDAERDRAVMIMDALPVGVVLVDRDGSLLSANRTAFDLAKVSPEEAAARLAPGRGRELSDWDGSPVAYEQTPLGMVMAAGGAIRGVHLSAVDGEGTRYYVSESAAPVFDERGEIESVVLSIEEMSDLRNAMENLRWTERIYRETVENLNEGMWVLDADAVTSFVSDRMASMLGYTPEEMTGRSVFDFVHEESERLLRHNLELRRQGVSQDYDLDFRHKDGHTVSTYLAAAPILDRQGNFIGAHAGVLDISGRKAMEKALKESVGRLEAQMNTSPDAITVTDLEGTVISASKRAAEVHGFGRVEELVGRSALEFIAPEERELALENLNRTLEEGSVRGVEYAMVRRDGGRFTGAINASLLRDAEGNPKGFIAITRDITATKEAENELRELNAELERFADVVSHELKGPISVLIASNHMLKGLVEFVPGEELRAQVAEVASLTENGATRAFNLVNDLLLLAESSQAPRRLERVPLDEVVRTVLEEKRGEIAGRGVTVRFNGELGSVVADRTHIYQLMSNLISNGLKHNDADEPVLCVKPAEAPGSLTRFTVCDNGSGIEEELMHTLFEPFSKSADGGAGLGLSIVSKVVEIYDGTVEARNEGGACFDVTLKDYPVG